MEFAYYTCLNFRNTDQMRLGSALFQGQRKKKKVWKLSSYCIIAIKLLLFVLLGTSYCMLDQAHTYLRMFHKSLWHAFASTPLGHAYDHSMHMYELYYQWYQSHLAPKTTHLILQKKTRTKKTSSEQKNSENYIVVQCNTAFNKDLGHTFKLGPNKLLTSTKKQKTRVW